MDRVSTDARPRRREYSGQFKASVLEQTRQPGASVSGIALTHGIHPNMVHRWIREERQRSALAQLQGSTAAFVPLQLPVAMSQPAALPGVVAVEPAVAAPSEAAEEIRIEIARAGGTVSVSWPLSAAAQCAQLLRDMLR